MASKDTEKVKKRKVPVVDIPVDEDEGEIEPEEDEDVPVDEEEVEIEPEEDEETQEEEPKVKKKAGKKVKATKPEKKGKKVVAAKGKSNTPYEQAGSIIAQLFAMAQKGTTISSIIAFCKKNKVSNPNRMLRKLRRGNVRGKRWTVNEDKDRIRIVYKG